MPRNGNKEPNSEESQLGLPALLRAATPNKQSSREVPRKTAVRDYYRYKHDILSKVNIKIQQTQTAN